MARKHQPALAAVSRSAFPANIVNDPEKRGQPAVAKVLFGEFSRYAIAPVYTRFDSIVWMVWDAETSFEDTKAADIIRIERKFEDAVKDLW